MRAEAQDETTASTTPAAGEQTENAPEEDATPQQAGAARDATTGQFTAQPQTQGTTATGEEKLPATLEEAIRVLNSVRGNLKTVASERSTLQRQAQEAQAEAARLKQESENGRLQAQHARFEELASRLPQEQQAVAREEYVRRLGQQAQREYGQELQQREQSLNQREFQQAKAGLPAVYEDIATYVASTKGIPPDELVAFVKSDRVANLIKAAVTPEAVQAVSISLGELLDYNATLIAGREAAAKESRRAAKATGAVRDMPNGVTAGGAQESEVARINKMDRDQFAAYKKQLLKAAQ